MSTIGGVKREDSFTKKVGLFEATVLCINPSAEEYESLIGNLKEDSTETEYLGVSKENNTILRIKVWLLAKTGQKFPATFFLEDKERETSDGSKKQYINDTGTCSWAESINDLPEWFSKRPYRVAYSGEEDLYGFLHVWLSKLNYKDPRTTLEIEWKKLMKGNVQDLKNEINGEWCESVLALATVITKEENGEIKTRQSVYSRGFLYPSCLKYFRVTNYSDEKVLSVLNAKKNKDLDFHEKFATKIVGGYGCKDYYVLRDLEDYDPDKNPVATNTPITETGSDY